MDRMRYVEPERRDDILSEAAAKAVPVVVTARRGSDWVTHKSHFLASPERGHHLLIAAPLTTEGGETTSLAPGEQVGVSFRRGHKKCMFGAVAEDAQEYPPAIVVNWPEQIQELQRRVYHRSPPPRGITIDVRFWSAEHGGSAATSPPDDAWQGTLNDISVGGIRIATTDKPDLRAGQTIVCHLAHKRGAPPICLEATFRHRQPEQRGNESIGLQFVGLEATVGGRKRLVRLAQIVSEFQRSHYGGGRRGAQPQEASFGL